jgi:hypothetical protein
MRYLVSSILIRSWRAGVPHTRASRAVAGAAIVRAFHRSRCLLVTGLVALAPEVAQSWPKRTVTVVDAEYRDPVRPAFATHASSCLAQHDGGSPSCL